MRDGLDAARALLPDVRLGHPAELGGSDRSTVHRVRAHWPDDARTTLIVKRFADAGEGWVRECAALAVLPRGTPAAQLVAAGAVPPVAIMSDLGIGASAADALLGPDATAAGDAVARWAESVAALHRATLGLRAEFKAALRERAGELPVADAAMSTTFDEVVPLLEDRCNRLDVHVPLGALAELRELPRRLGADGPAALSPSDTCPDNNVTVDGRLMLLDFEGAQWRHVAWDVAYLAVPWPTCWCSWRMPADVTERALEHYRWVMDPALPYVRTPEFRRDVAIAALGWSLVSTAWFLDRALADDPPPADPRKLTPTRRAIILHRLDGARRCVDLPTVAELAHRLRDALVQRWGEVPLGYAPAFGSSS